MPDVSDVASLEAMRQRHAEVYPERSLKANSNYASQLWAFARRVHVGDMVVLPLKTRSVVALGRVAGDYEYRDGRHVRPTQWVRTDVPRDDFGQDLLYSFGAFMTVCQIERHNAEGRIEAVLAGGRDPQLSGRGPSVPTADTGGEEEPPVDLEELAGDQIRRLIESRFRGHDLARLVEAVLSAQGYQTHRSPPGPDGGVDILAGHGALGFESPRLCIQVKSGGEQNDGAIRELEGVMSRMRAEQGLFVSWDGFTRTALSQVTTLFFKMRLWDDKQLIAALLENYDRLPEQIQAELPLKRVWVVVPEED
jgi:restriction system protein